MKAAEGYPIGGRFADEAAFFLRYATLAPSGHNSQPWLFRIGDRIIDLFADRARALPVVDPHHRELIISCGTALGTLETTALHFGYRPEIRSFPDPDDPDFLARVDFASGGGYGDGIGADLFAAIAKRRTTRVPFDGALPPRTVLETCRARARGRGVFFEIFTGDTERRAIARLVADADRAQFDDPAFRRELAAWVHSIEAGSRDGMSGAAFGVPDRLAPVARFVIRTFDLGDGIAAADEDKILSGTPMLGLLSSPADNQAAWLRTGHALSDILLDLTAAGFTASYLNQPIEVPGLRPKLAEVAGIGGMPQILLRIGHSETEPARSARRDLAEVIL